MSNISHVVYQITAFTSLSKLLLTFRQLLLNFSERLSAKHMTRRTENTKKKRWAKFPSNTAHVTQGPCVFFPRSWRKRLHGQKARIEAVLILASVASVVLGENYGVTCVDARDHLAAFLRRRPLGQHRVHRRVCHTLRDTKAAFQYCRSHLFFFFS